MSLIEELKRRRVFRVTGAYLFGAWIVLQVADTLFPALHLPPWTVTLVAAAVVIGFPIALLLGWAFDLTPGGIERTESTAGFRFPVTAAVVATTVVTLGVAAFVMVRRNAVASKLDENAVAVLPFRIAGDASLMVMREGMVDLLTAKLTGEGGLRAIDARTTLSAWRRKVENEKDDMPSADAVHLARSLGAGQVLLGAVIATPGKVSINAALHSAIDGTEITKAEDSAAPDSMLQLVDRVVAKLLSQKAGQAHRMEALLSESLPAVQAYLDGQRLYRRGNHFAAAARFNAALAQDSTFALAALGLGLARSWSGYGPDYQRGRDIAWKYRDRLPQPDREYVIAWLGAKYPDPRPIQDELQAWENIVARAPDRIEAWYELGDHLYHLGDVMGLENSEDRALEAWDNALRRDSAFVPALDHQITVYASRGDTAKLRTVGTLLFDRLHPELKNTSQYAWPVALALNDAKWLSDLRKNADTVASNVARVAHMEIVHNGLAQQDVPKLIDVSVRNAHTPAEKSQAVTTGMFELLNMGRPGAALQLAEQLKTLPNQGEVGHARLIIALASDYADIDSATVAAAITTASTLGEPPDQCVLAGLAILRGDYTMARKAIEPLRAAAPKNAGFGPTMFACAQAREVAVKLHDKAPDARAALARLDSLLANTPVVPAWGEHFALESIRYHVALGDYEGAYTASLRVRRDQPYGKAPLLLERARAAARSGKRTEAIAAYERYLKIRANPEPGRATDITNKAREELAALVGESRR